MQHHILHDTYFSSTNLSTQIFLEKSEDLVFCLSATCSSSLWAASSQNFPTLDLTVSKVTVKVFFPRCSKGDLRWQETEYCRILEGGMDICCFLLKLSPQSRFNINVNLLRSMSSWVLSVCKSGDSLDSLGILFQSLSSLWKAFPLYSGKLRSKFWLLCLFLLLGISVRSTAAVLKDHPANPNILPWGPWKKQLDFATHFCMMNKQLPQFHMNHMLQPLKHSNILVVLCWNHSSLQFFSFTGNKCD